MQRFYPNKKEPMEKYYTVKEAAEITKYSYQHLARLIKRGKLKANKPSGCKWLIKESDLIKFIEG